MTDQGKEIADAIANGLIRRNEPCAVVCGNVATSFKVGKIDADRLHRVRLPITTSAEAADTAKAEQQAETETKGNTRTDKRQRHTCKHLCKRRRS